MHIDLPDFGGSECSPDLRQRSAGRTVSWESPVLGESVSMYEAEETVQDILSNVKRLLAQPLPEPVTSRPLPQPPGKKIESFSLPRAYRDMFKIILPIPGRRKHLEGKI
jgi:hypothetical protein